jgi:hypothetical protein
MRPQQQGRRQRSRGSGGGGRRNQNPLSRNYESNGPDVKIRGNAQVIADKYAALARDAQSSGDSVMAENYLQHAEHYNRIIMAAQAQAQAQREERTQAEEQDSGDGSDGDAREKQSRKVNGEAQLNGHDASEAPQPVIGETPVEVALEEQEHAASGQSRRSAPRRARKPRHNPEETASQNTETGSESGESVAASDSTSSDSETVAAEA